MSLSKAVAHFLLDGSSHGPPSEGSCVLYIHRNYGYVVGTMVGSIMLSVWKASKVTEARKTYNVHFPTVYSDNEQFNLIQRAHQNTLEYMPAFLVLLLVGGLEMPMLCTIAGNVWILSRVMYANGCYSGDPKRRGEGAFGTLGLVVLLASAVKFGLKLALTR